MLGKKNKKNISVLVSTRIHIKEGSNKYLMECIKRVETDSCKAANITICCKFPLNYKLKKLSLYVSH